MNITTALKNYYPLLLCPFCDWTTSIRNISKEEAHKRWKEHLKESRCYKDE